MTWRVRRHINVLDCAPADSEAAPDPDALTNMLPETLRQG
jgi:hypothetical protein